MSKCGKEQITDMYSMDESPKHCTERKKPDTQEQIIMCLYEFQEQISVIYGERTGY